jgi:hypothetical protein
MPEECEICLLEAKDEFALKKGEDGIHFTKMVLKSTA